MIDITLLDKYGWPIFLLIAGAVALVRQYVVMGWTYQERVREVEYWRQRHEAALTQAQQATLSIREVLNLIKAPGVPPGSPK